jgi:hypothetical protein
MATMQGTTGSNEAAILNRVIRPEKDDLPAATRFALTARRSPNSSLS